jgi:hypothetical protein
MEVSDAFRQNADQCIARAQEAPNLESRAHWLVMGRLWFDLAQNAEEREMIPGSALLNDMAQMWVALVSQLDERMNGRGASPAPSPGSEIGIAASAPLAPTTVQDSRDSMPATPLYASIG